MTVAHDIHRLLFPCYCMACGRPLTNSEKWLCLNCNMSLPRTEPEESFKRIIALREVVASDAWLHYSPGGNVSQLIYEAKYHGDSAILEYLAEAWTIERGQRLLLPEAGEEGVAVAPVSVVVPMPLSARRERARGFNQSAVIADAICRRWNGMRGRGVVSRVSDCLVRVADNASQTAFDTALRQRNVEGVFAVRHAERLAGRHVLLVDDVLTSGASINECIRTLADAVEGIRISVFALGMA